MHRRIATTLIAAGLLATLTACSSSDTASARATTPTATTASPAAEYDANDCKALLERNYTDEEVHDASGDPECADLTHDEYVAAASEVVAAHKDDFLDQATNEVAWDSAWDQTPAEQQQVICDRVAMDGADAVALEMAAAGSPSGDEAEMLQYFADKKC
ncbi:hypothetical protein ACWCWD_06370 [Streptomyces sp. NPDC001493]